MVDAKAQAAPVREAAPLPASFTASARDVQYSGFQKTMWPVVQVLTRSGVLEHLHTRHPSIQSARVGVLKGKPGSVLPG